MNDDKIREAALKLGATQYLAYRIGKTKEIFSRHFFNGEGLEVAYNIVDHKSLTVLDHPRKWSEKLIQLPCYELMELNGNKSKLLLS